MFPSLASVLQFVDMMGWRLETADGVNIPVSFNPGSSSVVADLQELPSTVHSASWVAPPSYLGDKVTMACCSLHPCWTSSITAWGVVSWLSGRKVAKTEETWLITNAEDGEARMYEPQVPPRIAHS